MLMSVKDENENFLCVRSPFYGPTHKSVKTFVDSDIRLLDSRDMEMKREMNCSKRAAECRP